MSRIEEALRRARSSADEPAGDAETMPEPVSEAAVAVEAAAAVTAVERAVAARQAAPAPVEVARAPQADGESAFESVMRHDKLVVSDASPLSIEQYRRLAAILHHTQNERGIKIVMVASALPDEGKTLTASNLALTLSESYRRTVLLVDADLRRPNLHDIFDVANGSGLNDGLTSRTERKLTLSHVTPQLTVLPAGKPDPDPMSVLTSERMRRVLTEAAEKFDWVILDTPPVELLPDANLLAAMVDAAVLVVSAGRTPYTSVQRAIAAIGRERILGVVLNRVEDKAFEHGAYYQGYYGAGGKRHPALSAPR
jgi:capsular exopolysaccharide synthesis family protein